MAATFTVDANTTALYHMDGAVASAAKIDNAEGSSTYDLVETGTPTSGAGFNGGTDGSYALNGTSQGVKSTNNFTSYAAAAITFECWAKTSTTNGTSVIMAISDNTLATAEIIKTSTTYKFRVTLTDTTDADSPTIAAATLENGSWHYLAGTFDGSTVRLYLDGVEQGSGTSLSGNILTANPAKLSFGFRPSNSDLWWAGNIDEARVSNIARTATEISNYFNNNFVQADTSTTSETVTINKGVISNLTDSNTTTTDTLTTLIGGGVTINDTATTSDTVNNVQTWTKISRHVSSWTKATRH